MVRDGHKKKRVTRKGPFSSGDSSSGGRGLSRVKGVLGVRKEDDKKKSKIVSIKNQIRSIERLLKKPLLSDEVKHAQEVRLEDLRKQAEQHTRTELERKMALRYRKVKFFERRKIERRIRRVEKQLRTMADQSTAVGLSLSRELEQLKEDLEYVKFFPKTEKYVALFAGNNSEVVAVREELRKRIKENIAAAAASGVELEEAGSEDEAMDLSQDDFFMAGSSSDDADADDELTDRSPRLGDGDDLPTQSLTQTPGIAVKQKSSKRSSFARSSPKHEKAANSSAAGQPRVRQLPHSKQAGVNPWTSASSRSSSFARSSKPSSSAGKGGKSSSSLGDINRQSFSAGKRLASTSVNARKSLSRAGGASASHDANISDENMKRRSSVTSSHSMDEASQPKKRKRTRSKKKKK
ncbi:hypothetical protein R1sor_014344 [Riccia sorocarpa]|uniref:rRNA-processing protein EFG1 n=1 Tax=Riccia sorocarpa TaxID=122646 RepID=A0ABD3H960_9MARC